MQSSRLAGRIFSLMAAILLFPQLSGCGKSGPVCPGPPEMSDSASYSGFIRQALTAPLDGKENLILFVPEILKSRRRGGQIQFIAYVSYAQFELQADGRYYPVNTFTGPLQFYSCDNPSTKQTKTFYSLLLAPKAVDPYGWDNLEESTFDPQLPLKENLRKSMDQSGSERAVSFLEEEPDFSDSVWEDIIGKPPSEATPVEISAALKKKKALCLFARQNACFLYMKQSGRELVLPEL